MPIFFSRLYFICKLTTPCYTVEDVKRVQVTDINHATECRQVNVPRCEIVTIIKYFPVPDRECTVLQQNQCKTVSETTVEEDCKTESNKECSTVLDTKYETQYEEKCVDVIEQKCETQYEQKCEKIVETICDGQRFIDSRELFL